MFKLVNAFLRIDMKRKKSKIGLLGALSVSLAVFSSAEPAFSQNSNFPSGIYNAGSRYVFVAHNEDRTCYSAMSVPPGRYAIAVGETTGSLSRYQDGFIVDGWRDYYGKEVVLTLENSTIAVTHQGNHAGSYELYERRPSNEYRENYDNAMARCLNSEDVFFEVSPGYTITTPRIQTAQSQTTAPSEDGSRQSSELGSTRQAQSTPQPSTSGCDAAIAQLQSSLTDGRQLSIPYQDTKEAYGEYPEGRSVIYSLGIRGAAGSSILNSPQLLLSLGEAFLNNCSTAGAVSIGYYASSIGETIGLVNGRVALFECAEDIGIKPRGAQTREIPWGYHYCSL